MITFRRWRLSSVNFEFNFFTNGSYLYQCENIFGLLFILVEVIVGISSMPDVTEQQIIINKHT
jgi:hypothetical protein